MFPLRYFFRSLFLVLLLSATVRAQRATPWQMDPHAGTSGITFQPASAVVSPYSWEVNLLQVGFGVDTDYAFFTRQSLLTLLRPIRSSEPGDLEYSEEALFYAGERLEYGYLDGDNFYGRAALDVLGPALSLKIGESTSIGVFSRFRGVFSTRNIDRAFSFPIYDETAPTTILPGGEVYGAAASWMEVGLNLGQRFEAGYDGEIRVGANLKITRPQSALTLYNPTGSEAIRMTEDSVGFSNLNTTISLSEEVVAGENIPLFKGSGFAADLGVQYAWSSAGDAPYQYTLGLSLTDIGSLSFAEASEVHRFRNPDRRDLSGQDYSGEEDARGLIRQFSEDINDDPEASLEGNTFSIGLPTALSLQFAWQPNADFQVAAALTTDLARNGQRLSQGDELIISGSYGRWWYGGGASVTVQEFSQLNIGAYLRLGPVIIGTNRIAGTLTTVDQLRGGDFYVGVRLHSFGSGSGSGFGGGGGRGGRRGREAKCYEF